MRRRIRSLSARSRLSERIGHSSCWTAQRQPARALCGSTRTSGATCVAGHQVLTRYSRCRPRASVATVLRRTVCIASCTRSSGSVLWTISDGLCSAGNLLLNDRPAWTVDVRPAALRYGGALPPNWDRSAQWLQSCCQKQSIYAFWLRIHIRASPIAVCGQMCTGLPSIGVPRTLAETRRCNVVLSIATQYSAARAAHAKPDRPTARQCCARASKPRA